MRKHTLLPLALLSTALVLPAAGTARAGSLDCDLEATRLEAYEAFRDALDDLPDGPLARLVEDSGLGPAVRKAVRKTGRRYARRCVTLNQVQVLGSHNSYHIEPPEFLIELYTNFDPAAIQLQYTHPPLKQQFGDQGVRQIELDVFADPEGGLYSSPLGLQVLNEDDQARIPELDAPGIKVLHIQDLDWNGTCAFLEKCLRQIRSWSDAHPRHLPIFVLIEAKDEELPPLPEVLNLTPTVPLPWDATNLDDLDATIRSVFPPKKLITPDDVRGDYATLEDAVLDGAWPRLGRARGRVIFGLDNGGAIREAYRNGRTNLEGRVLFVDGTPGESDAAFVKVNDPVGNEDLIRDLVDSGYIVRTRADADTIQSRENDPTQRESALASAAQYVSTDYAEPDLRFSDYQVSIPDGDPGRCNPENAPPGCRSWALEK